MYVRVRPDTRGGMSTGDVTRITLRVIIIALLFAAALELLWLVRHPLSWIILALFLAVAMSRPVGFLSRYMPRGGAIALSYLTLVAIPFAIAAAIIPSIVTGANDLAREAPGYVSDLQDSVNKNEKLRKLDDQYGITDRLSKEAEKLPNKLGDAAGVLKDVGIGVINSIFAAFTILVLSIFMVASGKDWVAAMLRSIPHERRRTSVQRALETSANAVGNYVVGILIQMTIAGLSTWIVLTILGVDFAAPLAVVMALFDAVPLIGASLGSIVIGAITLFFDFPTTTIVWAVWAVAYQQLENYLIQPRIQSKAVDVQPFIVLVSVLFGSTLFGIAGALLAIPVAASLQIGIREYLHYRTAIKLDVNVDEDAPAIILPPPPPAAPPAPAA